MRTNVYTQIVLTAIAVLLGVLAFRPAAAPAPVFAQPADSSYYIEPGVTMIRKPDGSVMEQGKVFVDLRTGDIWGFPTLSGRPYPIDTTKPLPPVSEPMYLGRYDLSKMVRPQ